MRRLNITLAFEWGRDEPDEPDYSSNGLDAMVETVGAPERRQMGFAPPSDPIRSTGWSDDD